ncbi:hypothetical protein P7C70_g6330, partial [Phenoliferia sp. Uapishka_3]
MVRPLSAALNSQLEAFQLEVKDDIIHFLSIPYFPLLFDGVGMSLFFHFHFEYTPRSGGIRRQFRLAFCGETSRKKYFEFARETQGLETARAEDKTWEYFVAEDALKPKTISVEGRPPARVCLIFTATAVDKDGLGRIASLWNTQRIGRATTSALDKRNANIDWKTPLTSFFDSATTPPSRLGRTSTILEHYKLSNNKAWVARALKSFRGATTQMREASRDCKNVMRSRNRVETNAMSRPLTAAFTAQFEKFREDILYYCSYIVIIPYIPNVFEGVGPPPFFHFHFMYHPHGTALRSQFKLEFAHQPSRSKYVEWLLRKRGLEVAQDQAEIWERQRQTQERLPSVDEKDRPIPRMVFIFTAESYVKKKEQDPVSILWVPYTGGRTTPSGLDSRNADVDWMGLAKHFLDRVKISHSPEERTAIMVEKLADDKAWVARAEEAFADVTRNSKMGTAGTAEAQRFDMMNYCGEVQWDEIP